MTKQSWWKKILVAWWKKPLVRLWKEYFKYLVFAVILLLGAGVSLVYIGKEYLVYAIIVVVCLSLFCIRKKYPVYVGIVLLVAVVSLVYIPFAANGWCECIPLIGCIGVDKDPVRTAGVLFGTFLLLMNMYLVTVRIRRTDKQITETEKSNDLAKSHHGITMLYAGNAITQIGGIEYLHRLAEEAEENKQQREEVLRVFCTFLKRVPSSEKKLGDPLSEERIKSRQAKNLILRKMFINEEDREIYPNKNIDLRGADLSGADLWMANLSGANLSWAHLVGANLQDAGLKDAGLKDAGLKDANLEMATLLGADFRGAKLEGVKLKDASLNYAIIPTAEAYTLPSPSSVTFNAGVERHDGVSGRCDIIWMQDNTSFKWRKKEYDKHGLKKALENHLSQLEDKFLCVVVQSVISRLSS